MVSDWELVLSDTKYYITRIELVQKKKRTLTRTSILIAEKHMYMAGAQAQYQGSLLCHVQVKRERSNGCKCFRMLPCKGLSNFSESVGFI